MQRTAGASSAILRRRSINTHLPHTNDADADAVDDDEDSQYNQSSGEWPGWWNPIDGGEELEPRLDCYLC